MADRDSARLTAPEGRRFAFTLVIAFGVIGLIARWRGREMSAEAFAGIAAFLLIAGVLVPTRLRPLERAWMGLGLALSKVTTPIFLGVVYFLVFLPVGLIRRVAGKNSLARPRGAKTFWVSRDNQSDPEAKRLRMERQF